MILRSVSIENWGCIGRLHLADLPLGVIVLHGPNRTGKSSLVRAIRSCLFDHDHDTTRDEVRSAVPWNTDRSPHVAIEFETGGKLYRLAKQFSKRKDGFARLERREGSEWIMEVQDPKEASRRARELLGCKDSETGLNQLLWLHQGEVSLPQEKNLDPSLVKRLNDVLGTLITSRDVDIKQAIDKRCERWFTGSGEHRKGKKPSPVVQLENDLEERKGFLVAEEDQFRSLGLVIADLERCEDELPGLDEAVAETEQEVTALATEREATRERRREFDNAQRSFQQAQEHEQRAAERLRKRQEAEQRCKDAEQAVVGAESTAGASLEQRDVLRRQLVQASQELVEARRAEERHQKERQGINDCKEWLSLGQRHETLAQQLEEAGEVARVIDDLETKVKNTTAPDAKQIESLRSNRSEAVKLRARLQASELTITLRTEGEKRATLAIDGNAVGAVSSSSGDARSWPVRQRAELDIPEWGSIEVTRGQTDEDLEQVAQRLHALEDEFRRTIRAYGEDPNNPAVLDVLLERRLQLSLHTEKLTTKRAELRSRLPRGQAVVEGELRNLERQREALQSRSPEVATWSAATWAGNEADIQRRETAFTAKANALEAARRNRETHEGEARQKVRGAEEAYAKLSLDAAAARATVQTLRDELDRCGEEDQLQADLTACKDQVADAKRQVAATTLNDAEQSVEERHAAAESALLQRHRRCQEAKDQLNRLRGRLEENQGLHTRRTDAAAAVCEIERQLERERLEANAHLRLRTLFADCKDTQVQKVLGPIGARVLEWAKLLGLDDYREVRFGERFMPDGIVRTRTGTETIHRLDGESYGTEEQLSILVRLALAGVIAAAEPAVCILDDPLAHADPLRHRRMLDILRLASQGNPALDPPSGSLQMLVLTCHAERFDYLTGARIIDLSRQIQRSF